MHTHRQGGRPCPVRTVVECDDRYADWQATQQVLLAQRVVAQGRAGAYRKDKSVFGQLVSVLAGDAASIEGDHPFTRRIRKALSEA